MSTRVAIVFHSGQGHTRVLADAVARGARGVAGVSVEVYSVDAIEAHWADLAAADAIVFGCPTYMGSASAPFKAFMDQTIGIWSRQEWRDKIAAGFTNSSSPSGDKLSTLVQLAVFAAQHAMIWVGLDVLPGMRTSHAGSNALNRLGSHLGAMAQSPIDQGPTLAPPESDRRTAERLGARVAECAQRWTQGRVRTVENRARVDRDPTTATWIFPDETRPSLPAPLARTNVRELVARSGVFEHHLVVVARVGVAQLEVTTASEPLYFAHANISDEYALALPTGDAMIDGFPLRTFLSDVSTLEDVGRVNHRAGDLVLHPHGLLHWPGRLRPPFEPFAFPKGTRRRGVSVVLCASKPTRPTDRIAFVESGREADAKAYGDASVPFMLADTQRIDPRTCGAVGDTRIDLVANPSRIAPPRGGYVLVIEADRESHAMTGDLVYVPEGASMDGAGIVRALVLASGTCAPEPPPASWGSVPDPPFAPFEDGNAGKLPFEHNGIVIEARSDSRVGVRVGDASSVEVPRYWLARMLYRVALHGYRLGYVETYGGFFYDDTDGEYRLGVRDGGAVTIARDEIERMIEAMYRAVAPSGYTERLG